MTPELSYIIFNTSAGWIGILGSAKGLLRATLPHASPQKIRQLFSDSINHGARSPHLYKDLMERLKLYFDGHRVDFPDELDLSGATTFRRDVWKATRLIPYGETRSYAWVAEQIKKPGSARAVGQALGKNPLPVIIPCHRVLASDGQPGGFAGGVETKKMLLHLEG
jgi:methylated-DNA-[protein]-cysteine S-methyltransferase